MALVQQEPEISIIIPVHNQQRYLEALLQSLRAQEEAPAVETIVVDDGSTDDIALVCRVYGAQHLRIDISQGPANARNRGAERAHAPILLFLDADIVCPPTFLARVKQVMERSSELGGLSFLNQPYDSRDNVVRNYGAALERYWFLAFFAGDEEMARVAGLTSRNGVVRAEAFRAIRGFDTRFRTNAIEDYDFGKRLAAYCSTVLVRDPVVYHNFPSSLRRLFRNYWVRASLFVPYYLSCPHRLDKAQSSPAEALLRLVGASLLPWLLLAVLPLPGRTLWISLALLALLAYLVSIRKFLLSVARWSGSIRFTGVAAGIHLLSSFVIIGGAGSGLFAYVFRGRRFTPLTPIH